MISELAKKIALRNVDSIGDIWKEAYSGEQSG